MNNNNSCGSHRNHCVNVGPFTAVTPQCVTTAHRKGLMIPYASNESIYLYGLVTSTPKQIGFGSKSDVTIDINGQIILDGSQNNNAFVVSQAGSITAISATFTTKEPIAIIAPGTVEVRAQIYVAPVGSNVFSPTNATIVILSESTTVLPDITKANSSNIFTPVPIAVGNRVLMVYSATITGIIDEVEGTASASITIV